MVIVNNSFRNKYSNINLRGKFYEKNKSFICRFLFYWILLVAEITTQRQPGVLLETLNNMSEESRISIDTFLDAGYALFIWMKIMVLTLLFIGLKNQLIQDFSQVIILE